MLTYTENTIVIAKFAFCTRATTQNLKTTSSVRFKLQTSATADTIRKPQKNDRRLNIYDRKPFTNCCTAPEL